MALRPIALAVLAALLAAPADAQTLAPSYVTADGSWDCHDSAGTYTGTIVIVEKSYAYVGVDGRVGGYGNLFVLDDIWTPAFVVMGGYLLDTVGVKGVSLSGPREDVDNYSGALYLYATLSEKVEDNWFCDQRLRAQ